MVLRGKRGIMGSPCPNGRILRRTSCLISSGLETQQFMHTKMEPFRVGAHNRELFDLPLKDAIAAFKRVKECIQGMGLTQDDPVDTEGLERSWEHGSSFRQGGE
jgi:hypothetical protein